MTPFPGPSLEALPSDLDPDLADAIRHRRGYGLRSDLDYVRAVAGPACLDRCLWMSGVSGGVRGLPASAWRVHGRRRDRPRYTAAHGDEFGGIYLDEATRTGVVTLWTDHLAEHAGAIREAVGPDVRVAFAQVRYAERDLRRLKDKVSGEWRAASVADIPAAFESVGVDIKASQVYRPCIERQPRRRGDHPVALRFWRPTARRVGWHRSSLDPVRHRHRTRDRIADLDAWDLSLAWEGPNIGDCGGGDMGYGVNDRGRYELPCQVGTWTIKLMAIGAEDVVREVGRGTVKVVAGETVTLDIHADFGS